VGEPILFIVDLGASRKAANASLVSCLGRTNLMIAIQATSEFGHDVTVVAASRPFQVVLDFATGSLTPSARRCQILSAIWPMLFEDKRRWRGSWKR